MKTRVISSLVGIAILAAALFLFDTIIFVAIIGTLCALAVYELLHSTAYVKDRILLGLSCVFAFITPFMYTSHLRKYMFMIIFCYIGLLCFLFLYRHKTIPFSSVAIAFMFSCLVPSVFSILLFLRDNFPKEGVFYVFLVLAGAWVSDTGAFFAGSFFGKHKLAPEISPKKTVEGLIGGVAACCLGYVIIGWIFSVVMPVIDPEIAVFKINYLWLAAIAPFCSLAGVVGDLFASVVKRQTGIKDYGNIMPGHGGIMDRFDSVLFVSPVLFLFVRFLSIVQVIGV